MVEPKKIAHKLLRVFRHEGIRGVVNRIKHLLCLRYPTLYKRAWLDAHTPSAGDLAVMKSRANSFDYQPTISIIVPVYNPEESFLRDCLDSVLAQAYPNWELCLADDCSTKPYIAKVLLEYQARDARVKLVQRSENGHISKASNSALEVATGEFIALLDHDDTLAPHALFEVVSALNEDPTLDMLYSNEDKISIDNVRFEPTFKASWSPDYFMSFMYIGHLTVYRRTVVSRVGGFRAGFEGSQDYDLALRVTETTDRIGHIPKILYHWRVHPESVAGNLDAKPYAFTVARKALGEALERRGVSDGEVRDTAARGIYKACYPVQTGRRVGVFVMCDGASGATELSNIKDRIESHTALSDKVSIIPVKVESRDFVTSLAFAIDSAREIEVVVLLDGSYVPKDPHWVEHLLEFVSRSEVGVVGGKIVAPGDQLLHAGYTLMGSKLSNNFHSYPLHAAGYAARLLAVHNVTAVSSGCLAVRRAVLDETKVLSSGVKSRSGFEAYLGLSVQVRDQRVVWLPHVSVEFLEGAGSVRLPERVTDLRRSPGDYSILEKQFSLSEFVDPFYPPGLDDVAIDFRLAV